MKQNRRESALDRLTKQLVSGVKSTNDGPVELTAGDMTRINKEIATLKTRL